MKTRLTEFGLKTFDDQINDCFKVSIDRAAARGQVAAAAEVLSHAGYIGLPFTPDTEPELWSAVSSGPWQLP